MSNKFINAVLVANEFYKRAQNEKAPFPESVGKKHVSSTKLAAREHWI